MNDKYKPTSEDDEISRLAMEKDLKKYQEQGPPAKPTISITNYEPVNKMAGVKDVADAGGSSSTQTGVPLSHPLELMTVIVNENSWADLGVKTIGASCASTDPLFQVYSLASGRNKEKAANKKVESIIDKLTYPNPHQTGYELFLTTYENLATYANAYWQIIRTKSGEIHSIYTLPPETIRVIPYEDNKGILHCAYYQMDMVNKYNKNGGTIYLEHEIIHFKDTNEKSFLYGKPRLYSLMSHVTANTQAMTAINSWFEKGFAGGAIFKMDADETVAERNREFLREQYSGAKNYGEMMLLEGSVELVSDGQKYAGNLSFEKISAVGRDTILTCIGVPVSMAGVRSDAGMGNAEIVASEEKAFKRNVVDRIHRLVFDKINQKLIREFMGEKSIAIKSGTLSKFTLKEEIEAVKALSTVGIAVGEARELLGVRALENEAINDQFLVVTNNGAARFEDIVGVDPNTGDRVETIFEKQMAQQKEIATSKQVNSPTATKTNTAAGSPANK